MTTTNNNLYTVAIENTYNSVASWFAVKNTNNAETSGNKMQMFFPTFNLVFGNQIKWSR